MEPGTPDKNFNKKLFGNDFTWGISTAAFQIEGSCDADGKSASVWDTFSKKKGKIRNGDIPDTACDFYNRYQSDIDLVKQLNIPNFRFSISWPRVLPGGTGKVNKAGIAYYNHIIDHCIAQGIVPWITLYHWDLPQVLEDKGGWTNRDVIDWFTEFTTVCAEHFGDRVKNWMVMNEPSAFTGAGYFFGIHAPGKTGLKNFMPAVHHAVLSMVKGAKTLRKLLPGANIGSTFSASYIEPYSDKPRDMEAAKRADALINRLFIEPVLGLGYPWDDLPVLNKLKKYFLPGDEDNLSFDFDFIGLQTYTREIVKYSFFTPYLNATLVKAEKRNVPVTQMGWEVYPPAIYELLMRFNRYKKIRKILVTENGSAFPDEVTDGKINDPKRAAYLQTHLQQVLKAKNAGCKVSGYLVWTLTDNFEWAEGYNPRFGLVHVDFKTQQRIIKASGQWYADFLKY